MSDDGTAATTLPDPEAAAFGRASVGLAVVDGDGRFVRANPAFARLHDTTAERLRGSNIFDAIAGGGGRFRSPDALRLRHDHDAVFAFVARPAPAAPAPAPAAATPAALASPVANGAQPELTYRMSRLSPRGDPELYLVEAEARDAGSPEDDLAGLGFGPCTILDECGEIVAANDAAAELFGMRDNHLVGRTLASLAHPGAQQRVEAITARRAAAGPTEEFRFVRSDGATLWLAVHPDFDALARRRPGAALVSLTDRTDRRRDQLLLSETFDAAPRPFVMIDTAGTVLASNPAWRSGYGAGRTIETDRHLAAVLDPTALAELSEQLDVLESGARRGFEIHAIVTTSPEDPRAVRISGTALHDLEGRLERVLLTFDDETERALEVETSRSSAAAARATMDLVDVAVLAHDADGTVTEVNLGAQRLFGMATTDLIGQLGLPAWWRPQLLDGTSLTPDRHPVQRVLHSPLPLAEATLSITPPGSGPRCFVVRARRRSAVAGGPPIGAVATYVEVTEQLAKLAAADEDEAELESMLSQLPMACYSCDADLNLRWTNEAWSALVRRLNERGQPDLMSLAHPFHRRRLGDAITAALEHGDPATVHHRLRVEGEPVWVRHHLRRRREPDGATGGLIGTIEVVPDWVADSGRTRRLLSLVENTNDLVGEYDATLGRITYLNPRALELFVGAAKTSDEADLALLYPPDAWTHIHDEVWPTLQRDHRWEGELPMRTAAGQQVAVQQWITAEYNAAGDLVRLVAAGHDVTQRSQRNAELLLRATHDELTGLANRTLLLDHLELALGRSRRTGQLVALVLLDLDRFKSVNDQLGRARADRVLVDIADRLHAAGRPGDTAARLSGDEFAVVCDGVDDAAHALDIARRLAEVAQRTLASLERDGVAKAPTTSVGVALSAGTDNPEGLLRDAGAAMYQAKDLGGARIELFDETMRDKAHRRVRLASELRHAVGDGAITVHYQPSIDLHTGEVQTVEALVRWQHPERGLLPPGEFIAVADSTGMVRELGIEVLRQACTLARGWFVRWADRAPRIHVNLSPRQVSDPQVVERIASVLHDTGLPAERLCLELTESILLDDQEAAMATMAAIKALGVTLAIDDFGTGYSSLSYLSRLPVDV
ncbi:MAG: EAL domain-containing protein, partial [Acidimicrobiia bacterium]|nr:EAL domain-containing protein [Acidimicrobiia bacterium]